MQFDPTRGSAQVVPPRQGKERIAPTVGWAEAARAVWDVAVVGAGPAGALAARELARRGVAVLLVDKSPFPRPKVCGSCLNAAALAVLGRVGLGDLCARLGAVPLHAVVFSAEGRRAQVRLPAGVSLSRSALDAALVRAAVGAGAAFLPETCAEVGPATGGVRRLTLCQPERVTEAAARLVLVADGLGACCLRNEPDFGAPADDGSRIGAGVILPAPGPFFRPGAIFMATGRDGYVGAVRLEDGRLGVAAALDPPAVRRAGGPAGVAAQLAAEAGWPAPSGLEEATWRGTPALTRHASRRAFARVLLLGDAAGYVEPFTGEGIAWALTTGAAAAALVMQSLRRPSFDLASAWERRYEQLLGQRQARCRWVAHSLRYPGLVRAALRALAVVPGLAAPLIHGLNRRPPFPRT